MNWISCVWGEKSPNCAGLDRRYFPGRAAELSLAAHYCIYYYNIQAMFIQLHTHTQSFCIYSICMDKFSLKVSCIHINTQYILHWSSSKWKNSLKSKTLDKEPAFLLLFLYKSIIHFGFTDQNSSSQSALSCWWTLSPPIPHPPSHPYDSYRSCSPMASLDWSDQSDAQE